MKEKEKNVYARIKYAICNDCKKPIKSIFDIYDYIDENMQDHCVCGICLSKFIDKVGNEKAKKLIKEKRKV